MSGKPLPCNCIGVRASDSLARAVAWAVHALIFALFALANTAAGAQTSNTLSGTVTKSYALSPGRNVWLKASVPFEFK